MKRFAALLDRLAYEPSRNAKLRLMAEHFRTVPDPERGWALAALTGALAFRHAKPGLIRALVAERVDPVLFALSYDYVGDLSETAALIWPVGPTESPAPWRESELPFFGSVSAPATRSDSRSKPDSAGLGNTATPRSANRRPPPGPSASSGSLQGSSNPQQESRHQGRDGPSLSEVVSALASLGKAQLPSQLARWLD